MGDLPYSADSGRVIPPEQCDIRGCALPAATVVYLPVTVGRERIDLCERHATIASPAGRSEP